MAINAPKLSAHDREFVIYAVVSSNASRFTFEERAQRALCRRSVASEGVGDVGEGGSE